MLTNVILLADDPPADKGDQPQGSLWPMLMPIILIMLLYLFMIRRPMKRQEAERQALLASTEKGDKVLTTGGIIGHVVSANDNEFVVRIDDNVKVRVVKSAIAQNLTKLEAASQQQPQAAEKK
jgi:preprotein translocase subunit YajC